MKNHYETLNLDKNCSAKDIKDSFIKLSKKYHPDKNKSLEAHKKFVELNEAYSVLGKTHTRHVYDESLAFGNQRVMYRTNYSRAVKTPYEEFTERCAQNLKRDIEGSTYFTRNKITGVIVCLMLLFFGSGLQLMAESRRRAAKSQVIARLFEEQKEKNAFEQEREKRYREFIAAAGKNLNDFTKGEQ